MFVCSMIGTLASLVAGIFNPRVANKAGPDWLWFGGRDDLIRSLYFKPNGAFRRYGLVALLATLGCGSASLLWMVQRLA